MRSTVYVRNFESTLRLLAARGHTVHVAAAPHKSGADGGLADRLAQACTGITTGPVPARRPHGWSLLGEAVRRGIDYLRYLGPEYATAPKLRARAERTAPPFVRRLLAVPGVASPRGRAALAGGLRWIDAALPTDPQVDAWVRDQAPDLLVVTPLVEPGSPQSTYVRSARAAGVPAALCVYSWDNLTNKGLIHDTLDLVAVWNEAMRHEATTLHGVPADRIVVTGAPAYDQWFTWQPARDREAFLAAAGLPAGRPYLLYLCSSRFIAPDEARFVRRWITALRERSAVLAGLSVLVRPHPQNTEAWDGVDLGDLDAVSVWPRVGGNPIDAGSRADYFESIYYSSGVVGVNTSAQIESGIVGRRVFTLLDEEFRDTQEGTLHFHHLTGVSGGLLAVARDMETHVAQLEAEVLAPSAPGPSAFVEAFVRPAGLAEPATPRLVVALEATAAGPRPAPPRPGGGTTIVRNALRGLAEQYERAERDRLARDTRRPAKKAGRPAARKAGGQDERDRARQAREARRARRLADQEQKAAASEAAARARDEAAARACDNYRIAREHVCRMSAPEQERSADELRAIAVLAALRDTAPPSWSELRRLGAAAEGADPGRYDAAGEARKRFFLDQGRLLKVGTPALLVPEPPLLGGFGFAAESDDGERLFNDETLGHFEVLSALECGAVLTPFAEPGAAPVFWQPGARWAGLAYHVKSVYPHATYVITAAPELLIASATYLMTLFPGARVRFHDEVPGAAFWRDLSGCDFAFATEAALADAPAGAGLDVALDTRYLERTSPAAREATVEAAHRMGVRYFYSLGPRDHEPADGGPPLDAVLARRFWMYELPVPRYDGMPVLHGFRGTGDGVERVHRLGWRRRAA
ncbi:MAG: hypothetical protein AB7O67_04295 [Vicinamibacterales bacterium]